MFLNDIELFILRKELKRDLLPLDVPSFVWMIFDVTLDGYTLEEFGIFYKTKRGFDDFSEETPYFCSILCSNINYG